MDSIKHAIKGSSAKTKSVKANASKNANQTVAKDGNVRMSTRLHAAKNAISDKLEESKHNREAEVHKHASKHNY